MSAKFKTRSEVAKPYYGRPKVKKIPYKVSCGCVREKHINDQGRHFATTTSKRCEQHPKGDGPCLGTGHYTSHI